MRNIILEGPDNAGKSTVAEYLRDHLGWNLYFSGGREEYPGEINERASGFEPLRHVIFDRHPVISQEIYRQIHKGTPIHPHHLALFYAADNLIIYCRPYLPEGLDGQVIKAYDKPEHVQQVRQNYALLVRLYDEWAVNRAHIIRRKYDPLNHTLGLVKGALTKETKA